MTAEEAKTKLESWRDLLKAKLEGVTPGPWEWEYGVSMRTAWGLFVEDANRKRKWVLRFGEPNDIYQCPDPEEDMVFIEMAPSFARALLAGIEVVLKNWEGIKEWDGSGDGYDQGKCDGVKEDVIALAKAYEPYFQEVQS